MTYLDWAATAIPDAELQAQAQARAMECYGNPSSLHAEGRSAKSLLESARTNLVSALFRANSPVKSTGRNPGSLVFTGSGTEADQIVLLSLLRSPKYMQAGGQRNSASDPPHIIISAIEHPAIYAQAQVMKKLGFDVTFVNPESSGAVSPSRVAEALRPSTILVAIMAVNNETGAIQDIAGIGKAVAEAAESLHMKKPLFHVDCVQALGKVPLDLPPAFVSSAAFSAHKIGGPRSVGALWLNAPLIPLAEGGGQEGGIRSGTENIFGALAFSMCAQKAARNLDHNLQVAYGFEEKLISGIRAIPGAIILPECRLAHDSRWSPWVLSAAFPGLSGEVFARALSDSGFAVSTGSACSHTHRNRDTRVLSAMGIPGELAFSTIRISFGPTTLPGEIETFLNTSGDLYRKLKT
ncbi:MAG: cysteine desulfurase [Spirochaetaceae bacterium]|nr:cysteine desulfurase [Spirochaetaceae bacterium]